MIPFRLKPPTPTRRPRGILRVVAPPVRLKFRPPLRLYARAVWGQAC